MKISLNILTAFTLALSYAMAARVDLIGYADRSGCSGKFFSCQNANSNFCCNLPSNYGVAVAFSNVPTDFVGTGYWNENCFNTSFTVGSTNFYCWTTFVNSPPVRSLRYAHKSEHKLEKEDLSAENNLVKHTDCVGPNTFQYVDDLGATKSIKVPGATVGAAGVIADLEAKKDYAALAKYEAL